MRFRLYVNNLTSISLTTCMTISFDFYRLIVIPLKFFSNIFLLNTFLALIFKIELVVITKILSCFQLNSLYLRTRSINNISFGLLTCCKMSGSRAKSSVLLKDNFSSLSGARWKGLSWRGSI